MFLKQSALLLVVSTACGVLLLDRAGAASGELTIYVDAQARAGGNGLSKSAPLGNVGDAQTAAMGAYAGQSRVRVLIAPGNYNGQSIQWRWRPQNPIELVIEGVPGANPPKFDGGGSPATWASFNMAPSSNITVRHVMVANYREGVVFYNKLPNAGSNDLVEDSRFESIGKLLDNQKKSYAVIGLTSTTNSVIRNNTFADIANDARCRGLHAVYMKGGASNNLIENNRFENVCGDVLKVRNGSDNNRIFNNQFAGQNTIGMVVESYEPGECPSIGTVVRGNTGQSMIPYRSAHRRDVAGCATGPRFIP